MTIPEPDPIPTATSGSGDATRVALALALVLVLVPNLGPVPALVAAVAIGAILAASIRWDVGAFALVVFVLVGVGLRIANASAGSDVLRVTHDAIDLVLRGGNPYGLGFPSSTPPGAPFPYGPLTLVWYLPVLATPEKMELLSATAVMTVLALTRRPIGLAVYATAPVLVQLTLDGSNDTSAGLLILAALAVTETRRTLGAGLLAVAVAFKPYALAWAPLVLLSGGLPAVAAFVGASAVLWVPVLRWGPGAYLESLRLADGVHERPYASLAALFEKLLDRTAVREVFRNVGYASGALAMAASLRWARSHDAIVVAGALVFAATLYLGYWATFAYLAAIAPILCWKLDGWAARVGRSPGGLSSAR